MACAHVDSVYMDVQLTEASPGHATGVITSHSAPAPISILQDGTLDFRRTDHCMQVTVRIANTSGWQWHNPQDPGPTHGMIVYADDHGGTKRSPPPGHPQFTGVQIQPHTGDLVLEYRYHNLTWFNHANHPHSDYGYRLSHDGHVDVWDPIIHNGGTPGIHRPPHRRRPHYGGR
jgi:hypothetical protein